MAPLPANSISSGAPSGRPAPLLLGSPTAPALPRPAPPRPAPQDNIDIRLAGIGGLSEFLGWTTVQREASKQMGAFGGWENLLKVVRWGPARVAACLLLHIKT